MSITYRPARAEDLEMADALVVSINDLTERTWLRSHSPVSPPLLQSFPCKMIRDGLWVAEQAGKVLGFTLSWVCDDLWFLAQLFVAPAPPETRPRRESIKRALGHAQMEDAKKKP